MFKAFNHLISKVEITFTDGNVFTIEGANIPTAMSISENKRVMTNNFTVCTAWGHFRLALDKFLNAYAQRTNNIINDDTYLMYINEGIDESKKFMDDIIKAGKDSFLPIDDNMNLFAAIVERKLCELRDMNVEDRYNNHDIPEKIFNLLDELNGNVGVTIESFSAAVDRIIGPCVSVTAYSPINREYLNRPYVYNKSLCCTYFTLPEED